eukprot:CAMPEP_0194422868 /NCGR_PEP_ID=MMETSP0176-20130528/22201_1 /TAXON_ID=216777 /ORGANISM="Proboscia alata, Strain PI-D3" /LENGTH=274 /DNA_ID=CAMNT_0039231861 /DNA_START=18 /DNA_END=842 /DNA_ORIENTATION=-
MILAMKELKTLVIWAWLLHLCFIASSAFAQQDPSTMNGGSMMAMAGRDCAVLAVDKRFGSGPQMVTVAPRRCLVVNSKLMVSFTGLDGDVQTIAEELSITASNKISRETNGLDAIERRSIMTPRAMATITSHVLYSKRSSPSFCEPLIVGLEANDLGGSIPSPNNSDTIKSKVMQRMINERRKIKYKPFICLSDMIGAQTTSRDFACAGAASKSMYGTAEAMWQPGMSKDQLVQVCGRAFLSAMERDCLSGYGAIIYLITPDGIEEYDLMCRND